MRRPTEGQTGERSAGKRERRALLASLRLHTHASLVPEMDPAGRRGFVADIGGRGLVVPLDVTPKHVILDGRERYQAALELGLTHVPVRIVVPLDELDYMVRAAIHRRQLDPSQRAAIALELAEVLEHQDQAEARRLANLRRPEVATLPPRGGNERNGGKSRDFAARLAGVSSRTVQDVLTVKKHAPELFTAVKAGTLPAHRAAKLARRKEHQKTLVQEPLPEGPFELLYADPPWELGSPDSSRAPENHYPTLPLAEIKTLPVPLAEDAVCFLWAVSSKLPQALEVMAAWGFTYATSIVWVKPRIGLGAWVRHRHELLLLGRKGSVSPPAEEDRPDSVIEAANGRHSQKPACVYDLIERAYPAARKLELYARGRPRSGWTAWGNEVEA